MKDIPHVCHHDVVIVAVTDSQDISGDTVPSTRENKILDLGMDRSVGGGKESNVVAYKFICEGQGHQFSCR